MYHFINVKLNSYFRSEDMQDYFNMFSYITLVQKRRPDEYAYIKLHSSVTEI